MMDELLPQLRSIEIQPDTLRPAPAAGEVACACDDIEIPPPAIGSVLDWSSPSLFNGSSIRDVTLTSRYDNPRRRPVLPLLLASIGGDGCAPRPGLTLRLAAFFSHGHSVPSLVYACIVEPLGHVVVLKLLVGQEGTSPHHVRIPQDVYDSADQDYSEGSWTAMMAISREADRYEQLAVLQGTTVPLSYGFYQFDLPEGPCVVGHVMEYVPSVNIKEYFDHIKHNERALDVFMARLCDAYVDIHRLDVCHMDAGIRNLRLLPKGEIEFVIVDFGQASSIRHIESQGLQWFCVEEGDLEELFEELDLVAIYPWRATDNGKKLLKCVLLGPDELAALEADTATAGTLY